MSFQSYLSNVEAKTGKSPADFRQLAAERGFSDDDGLCQGVKVGTIVDWLKADFSLGHGHSMAIVALLRGSKKEGER